MRKLWVFLLLALFLIGWGGSGALASVTVESNGASKGEATTINFGGASTSTDGSKVTVNLNVSTISSGTINGATIGATTPAAGKFTTLESTGLATLASGSVTGVLGVTGVSTLANVTTAGTNQVGTLTVTGSATVAGNTTTTGKSTANRFVPGTSVVVPASGYLDCSGGNIWTLTPNQHISCSVANAAKGFYGLSITTSGTTSYDITFSTGLKTTKATYGTGPTNAKVGGITFFCDGTNLIEVGRIEPPQ